MSDAVSIAFSVYMHG